MPLCRLAAPRKNIYFTPRIPEVKIAIELLPENHWRHADVLDYKPFAAGKTAG
jgi:hypothetical protein